MRFKELFIRLFTLRDATFTKILLCSECFSDQGLKKEAENWGVSNDTPCRHCSSKIGKKLTKYALQLLADSFFSQGTFRRVNFGGASTVAFNEAHYSKTNIDVPAWLKKDLNIIEETLRIGFFYYGPRLWLVGEIEPLKSLQIKSERKKIIDRIVDEYPTVGISSDKLFYRVRKNPTGVLSEAQFDSPPSGADTRLNSKDLPVLYASQDIEVCVHECRVTVEDEIFIGTLRATKNLKLLDLTEVLIEDVTEFESLDLAVNMLFFAGSHSYYISQEIALAAHKKGFDGIIYPSYFSSHRLGTLPFQTSYGLSLRLYSGSPEFHKNQVIPNIALFGHPVAESKIQVECINRLLLKKVSYTLQFGPLA